LDGTKYTYGGGLVRSLESRMLTAERVVRMVNADSFESAFAVLNESGYVRLLDKLSSPFNYEELLMLELKSVRNMTRRTAPESEIISSLWSKYDYHNLKVLLKSRLLKSNGWKDKVIDLGNVPAEELVRSVIRNEDRPPAQFREHIARAEKEPEAVDSILELAHLEALRAAAGKAGVPMFSAYVRSAIDSANIRLLFRAKAAGRSAPAFAAGGAIDRGRFSDYFRLTPEEVFQRLKYTDYSRAVSSYSETRSLQALDRALSEHAMNVIREARHVTFGVEPLLGFVLAKEHETKTLRMIFAGKAAGIDPELLRERIGLYYA